MNSILNRLYYHLKPAIPRSLQLRVRRKVAFYKRNRCQDTWPIDPSTAHIPKGWTGWPDGKQFALVLSHDVDTAFGVQKVRYLAGLEQKLGFRSSFNFVPERYNHPSGIRAYLVKNGFEIAVHGLLHDGKLYWSREIFAERAVRINEYLKKWGAIGFHSPSMQRNLEWIHDLDIEYDQSTFDTDPFEPQPEGIGSIFPLWIPGTSSRKGYVELPYTLPQDHALFVILQEKDISIWKQKLDWLAERGGMALLNTHPDYMNFNHRGSELEEYPAEFYADFLQYIQKKYQGQYWHVLPREIASFWRQTMAPAS